MNANELAIPLPVIVPPNSMVLALLFPSLEGSIANAITDANYVLCGTGLKLTDVLVTDRRGRQSGFFDKKTILASRRPDGKQCTTTQFFWFSTTSKNSSSSGLLLFYF